MIQTLVKTKQNAKIYSETLPVPVWRAIMASAAKMLQTRALKIRAKMMRNVDQSEVKILSASARRVGMASSVRLRLMNVKMIPVAMEANVLIKLEILNVSARQAGPGKIVDSVSNLLFFYSINNFANARNSVSCFFDLDALKS